MQTIDIFVPVCYDINVELPPFSDFCPHLKEVELTQDTIEWLYNIVIDEKPEFIVVSTEIADACRAATNNVITIGGNVKYTSDAQLIYRKPKMYMADCPMYESPNVDDNCVLIAGPQGSNYFYKY